MPRVVIDRPYHAAWKGEIGVVVWLDAGEILLVFDRMPIISARFRLSEVKLLKEE
jgi:hypothetical protein